LFYWVKGKCVAWGCRGGHDLGKEDGHRFICKVETCNASYSAKYLHQEHNFFMKFKEA